MVLAAARGLRTTVCLAAHFLRSSGRDNNNNRKVPPWKAPSRGGGVFTQVFRDFPSVHIARMWRDTLPSLCEASVTVLLGELPRAALDPGPWAPRVLLRVRREPTWGAARVPPWGGVESLHGSGSPGADRRCGRYFSERLGNTTTTTTCQPAYLHYSLLP